MIELVRAASVEALPKAINMVDGLLNVRGEIAPVFDLRSRFGVLPVRKTVRELLTGDRGPKGCGSDGRGLDVVGVAGDGREALALVETLRPDVVTLDLDMPVMDGMTCLGHLVREHHQPVVVLSTLARENAFETFKALAMGAIDFVTKPGTGRYLANLDEFGEELRGKIRTAATIPRSRVGRATPACTAAGVAVAVANAAAAWGSRR